MIARVALAWALALCLVPIAAACATADPPDPDLMTECIVNCKLETQRPEPECAAECAGAGAQAAPWGFCACAAPVEPADCPSITWKALEARCAADAPKICPVVTLLHPVHVHGWTDGAGSVACGFPPPSPALYLATLTCDDAAPVPVRVHLFCY